MTAQFRGLIGKVATGAALTREEAAQGFDRMMSGAATPSQMGGFLMALRVRGETVDEITGAVTAETDGLVMGAAHKTLPVHGVQFHPESIASEHGHRILKNFLDIAAAWNASTGRRQKTPNPPQRARARAN